jgi:hypothetical protein
LDGKRQRAALMGGARKTKGAGAMQQQQRQGTLEDLRTATNWFALICQSMAVSVEVFLHDAFGERYVGGQGLFACLVLLILPIFFPHDDCRPLLWFLLAYLIVCFAIRIETTVRRRRGTLPAHTRYNGWPFLMRLFPRAKEVTIKRFVEPLLVCAVGMGVIAHNQPLGFYLMAAGFSLAMTNSLYVAQQRVRAMDMNDAVISQSDVAERFRDMHR